MWVGRYSEQREMNYTNTDTSKDQTVKDDTDKTKYSRPWDIDSAMVKNYEDKINKMVTEKTTKVILRGYCYKYLDKPCEIDFLPDANVAEGLQNLMEKLESEIDKKLGHDAVLNGYLCTEIVFEE